MGPHIVRNEGPLGLFKGVDASAARQLVYSGVAWLELFFFLHVPSFFFHFGSFGLVFFHSNFLGEKNAYVFSMGRFWKVIVVAEKKPRSHTGGALRNVRHAEGRS